MSGRPVRHGHRTAASRSLAMATFLAAGLIAAPGCPFAAPASAQEPGVAAPTLAEDLDSIAAAPVRAGAVAGLAVAVIRGGDTLLMRGYGSADLELDVPMPDDAVFEIGSATKQFTAAAILRLAEDGKLDLDHLLTEYLPRYPLRGNAVTVRQLLDHTSGIRGYTEIPGFRDIERQSLPRDSLVRLFADPPFDFAPGTAMIYNNSAYYLLGLIIEEVSGMPYADYIETEFFAPLGMRRSSYCSNARVVENPARGYRAVPEGSFRRAEYLDHAWPYAAGSLCSTAGDLVAWLQALHGGEVLGAASYRAMITPDTLAHGHRLRYAKGLAVDEDRWGRSLIRHGGAIPGYLTETRYYPDHDLHIVVLLNTLGPAPPEAIAEALADRVLGEPGAPELRSYTSNQDALTGTFTGAGRGRPLSVTIRREGGELVAVRNDAVDTLRYLADETFTSDPKPYGVTETYTFVAGPAGAMELHLDVVFGHYVLRRADETSSPLWASRTPVTSMVDVDGHRVRIRTAAPDPRRLPGQPLVVLEAGFGSTVNSWGPFIGQVATVTPVLAYDRAGLGESEWDGHTPTFEHITGRLRRLLAEVAAEPPFVLVGHSFGGDLVRFFADHYPAETVGLVLLDPVVSSPGDFMRALEEIGAGEAEYLEVHGAAAEGPPGLRAEDEMTKEFFLNHVEPDLPRPTDLPVSIIVSGLDVPPDAQEQYSFDVARHVQAVERMKVARLGEWILQVPEGQMTVVPASGHFVHRDEPELALETVRSVVYPDIARALLAGLDSEGEDAAVARYDAMKLWYPVNRFHEPLLNQLGYRLLRHGRTGDAIAMFRLNVREYPDAPNTHDSLGDAYREASNLRLAERSYARAVELAEAAGDSRVEAYRRRLVEVRTELAAAAPGGDAGVVHVAPPTGDRETDRASILAALGDVEPGGTVQFAPGTYLMGGPIIRITIPRVTLAGHVEGTTLRGCHPDEFPMQDPAEFGNSCNGLELAGGSQTVRNLTIEHAFWALHVGCCWDSSPHMLPGEGGHLIEANIFRSNANAVRVHGYWSDPTVIRNNQFLNNWHSVAVYGNTVHLLDNSISVPEPEEVQRFGFPADGIHIARPQSLHESAQGVTRSCENNVVSGNRIDGATEGIMMTADDPQIICRNNVIRDNTIIIRRARPNVMPAFISTHDEADSTVVGVPLALRGPVEDNLIEGNVIRGAEGLGIEIRRASRNRIVNNTIAGVARREPFPGNAIAALPVLGGDPEAWRGANGSGIWLSPGSDDNEIAGNMFEDLAGAAIFLEGDRNRVELQSADDAVRDLGTGNRVTQAAAPQEWTDRSPHEIGYVTVAPDVRLEVLDWGGDGLPLVFLAGANFNAHSFDDFAPRFTDTHRVLGITRRGHGASSWPDSGYDLPTLVEDIRVVLDSLGIDRAILAGHSMAGSEMTLLATESPDRVAGLIYIDAGHDPTDIGRLRVEELCSSSFSPGFLAAMERTFENPELVRRTQWHTGEDGVRRPFASAAAGASIDLPTPNYSGVVAPALGIYYVPERTEDLFMGLGDPAGACVAAFHRYIHGGIAAFTEGLEQATVIALSDTNHNIHLASPAALEAVMRQWLDSHAAPDPTDRFVREHMEALGIPAVSLVVMRNGVVLREAAYGGRAWSST